MPPMHLQLACVIRACAPTKWHPTANTLCPHDQKALELCCSYAQNKAQKYHPENSLATGDSFEHNTYPNYIYTYIGLTVFFFWGGGGGG